MLLARRQVQRRELRRFTSRVRGTGIVVAIDVQQLMGGFRTHYGFF
jgi:hypothetical protein